MEVWAVVIGLLPMKPNKKVLRFIKWVSKMDGFMGIQPSYPNGTFLVFKTENDAKVARNLIRDKGIAVGKELANFVVNENTP